MRAEQVEHSQSLHRVPARSTTAQKSRSTAALPPFPTLRVPRVVAFIRGSRTRREGIVGQTGG